jgi:hypothetical protein
MYDEVMLSSMSTPLFKVTFPCSIGPDTGSQFNQHTFDFFWRDIKVENRDYLNSIRVQLIDDHGTIIADGTIFEYTENRENFELEILCKSDISVFLDVNDGTKEGKVTKNIYHSTSPYDVSFRSMFEDWLSDIWVKVIGTKYSYDLSDNTLLWDLAFIVHKVIKDKGTFPIASYNWQFTYSYTGTRYQFLVYLAQILRAKIVFDFANEIFRIFPFSVYEENPVVVTGYVISETWDMTEQNFDDFTHFTKIARNNISGQEMQTYQNEFKAALKNRLSKFVYFRQLEIWGYANQTLFSGQSISLDHIKYYIKDISYEYETLNDMKTFKAICIRFDETDISGYL